MRKEKKGAHTHEATNKAARRDERGAASTWQRFTAAVKRAFTPAPEDTISASVTRAKERVRAWAARPYDVMDAQRFCGRIVFWLVMISLLIAAVALMDSCAMVSLLIMLALAVTLAVKVR